MLNASVDCLSQGRKQLMVEPCLWQAELELFTGTRTYPYLYVYIYIYMCMHIFVYLYKSVYWRRHADIDGNLRFLF